MAKAPIFSTIMVIGGALWLYGTYVVGWAPDRLTLIFSVTLFAFAIAFFIRKELV